MDTKWKISPLRVSCDSKKIGQGSCFVACDGASMLGKDFIQQALNNGATRIVADLKYQADCALLIEEYKQVQFSFVAEPRPFRPLWS